MQRVAVPLAIVLVATALFAAFTAAQSSDVNQCGWDNFGVQLRFFNPDLMPGDDPNPHGDNDPNVVEASGQFFIQFQAIVDEDKGSLTADDINSFWFHFGAWDENAVNQAQQEDPCGQPEETGGRPWLSGPYLYGYRADYNPDDGFFVPVNTSLVPDDDYAAAVYACTATTYESCRPDLAANSNVKALWYVHGRVDNCDDAVFERGCGERDFTKPWPIVLPGDGQQTNGGINGAEDDDLTIEFGEPLASDGPGPDGKAVRMWVNGIEKTDELEYWTPRARDDDSFPGNDLEEPGSGPKCLPPNGQPFCSRKVWGDGFRWDAAFSDHSTIRVWAMDQAGNEMEKIVSLTDTNRGGSIPYTVVDVDMEVEPEKQSVQPGEKKEYTVNFANNGNNTAHVKVFLDTPSNLTAKLSNHHVDLPPGQSLDVALFAGPKEDVTSGEHKLEVMASYVSGGQQEQQRRFPVVIADPGAGLDDEGGDDDNQTGDDQTATTGEGFSKACDTSGELEVCYVTPDPLPVGSSFDFEVQVRTNGEHTQSVGEADLTLQYLSDDRSEVLTEDTYGLEEKARGIYRSQVQWKQKVPTRAVFSSERVETRIMIYDTGGAGESTGGPGAGSVPGFGVAALVAAVGGALWVTRRD